STSLRTGFRGHRFAKEKSARYLTEREHSTWCKLNREYSQRDGRKELFERERHSEAVAGWHLRDFNARDPLCRRPHGTPPEIHDGLFVWSWGSWKDEPVPGQTLPFRLRGCCTSERLGAALRRGDFGRISAQGTPKSRGKRKLFWKRNAEQKWNGLIRNRFS